MHVAVFGGTSENCVLADFYCSGNQQNANQVYNEDGDVCLQYLCPDDKRSDFCSGEPEAATPAVLASQYRPD